MATHTTYYNLTKPAQNDKVNIGVLNNNADIIDTTLHNKVNTDELTADNVMLSDGVTSVEDALDAVKNNSWVVLNNKVKYKVSGGFVYISAILSNTNDKWVSLGTMPEGLRPSNKIYSCCHYYHASQPKFGNLCCFVSGDIKQLSNDDIPNGFLVYPVE